MENMRFYKAWEKPFEIFGLLGDIEKNGFRRIPEKVANNTSFDVHRLHIHTSGGRVRFRTDSSCVILKINGPCCASWHLTAMVRNGADLYVDHPHGSIFTGAIKPKDNKGDCTEEIVMPAGEHDITVYRKFRDRHLRGSKPQGALKKIRKRASHSLLRLVDNAGSVRITPRQSVPGTYFKKI